MFKSFGRSSSWIRRSTSSTNQQSSTTAAISTPAVSASKGSGGAAITSTSPNLRHSIVGGTALTLRNLQLQPQAISTQLLHRTMSSEAATSSAQHKHTNRLAQEKSPYLLQHAHNPVDWYPWGDEAIELARKQNKLIFLSVGYSTCHWCHVMEHESFENEAVAKIMNENFINIKVDREERPDIDKIYMQFVLMMNGSGGWPMSVWLTPDLAPITAGTYFPPHDRWGMPSFTTVLKAIAEKWSTNQEELKSTGLQVIKAIQKTLTEKSSDATFEPGSADAKLKEALKILKQRYDQEFGGFGSHPKFPEVARINFLFHAYIVTKDMDVLDMALQTLQKIGNGGIHDHIFGGFARYSVDREWHVPHFEKMLYDQGQLMAAYANAYKMTKDGAFLKFAEGIFNYIMKDLHHPDGGFYSGEDADSLPTANDTKKVEGAFYAWTAEEIRGEIAETETLYDEGFDKDRVFEIYKYHYDVRTTGNVLATSDPHGHLNGKNVLIVRDSEENTCAKFNITTAQLESILRVTNEALLKRRNQRPRPHLDTKIISSWNGLVLSGLSKLANCNSERRDEYMNAGRQLVNFIKENLFDAEKQMLLRSCYGVGTDSSELESVTSERIEGFLDDYSFVIKGLCDYYKASLDGSILQWAKELQDIQDKLFWDSTHGAYYFSQENSPNVVARLKSDHDGAEPCGNSVAARNLILLAHYFDDDNYRQRAGKLLNFFADEQPFGYALPEMMCALMLHENGLDLVAVVGPDTEATKRFVEICRKFYIPGMIIVHVDPQQPTTAYSQRVQEKFKMINNKPTVYICHDKVCRMPVTDPVELEENLTENFFQKERI